MFNYADRWFLPIVTRSILLILMILNIFALCRLDLDAEKTSLRTILKSHRTRPTLRIVYFRELNSSIEGNRLRIDIENLTQIYRIDLQLHILNQSTPFVINKLCSLINAEQRDTVFITDLYTKEIDLISRSLQIPTIATTNRYSIVQGKLVSLTREESLKRSDRCFLAQSIPV